MRTHRFSPSLPLNRWSSGTSWLPDSSLHAYYFHEPGNWKIYSQLNLFLRYNRQDVFQTGKRHSEKFDAPGFFLTRAETKVSSKSRISFTAMLSAEPFTVDGKGYPLLFQTTGQTWKGVPLTDRQNPHDLLMELSAAYVYSLTDNADLFVYTAYPGEPSVGPPSQMRRATAVGMPSCALAHHHQDATHISHGVVTGGFRFRKIQLEGSWFNGNMSDEDRWKPDPVDLNSYSYRISLNRRPNSALQLSQAWIPNTGHIGTSTAKLIRSTFSILRASAMSSKVFLMSAFVIGVNSVNGEHSPSVLFETTYQYKRSALFNRAELVKRTAAELKIPRSDEDLYAAQLSIGYQHRLFRISKTDISLGLQGSVFAGEDPAVREYGEFPVSAEVFLRIYPQMQQPGKQPVSYYER